MLTNSNEIVNDISRTKIEKSKNIIFTLKNSRKYKLLKRLVKLPILTFFQKKCVLSLRFDCIITNTTIILVLNKTIILANVN